MRLCVAMYLMCGPRQPLLFQGGPETPKGCTPLVKCGGWPALILTFFWLESTSSLDAPSILISRAFKKGKLLPSTQNKMNVHFSIMLHCCEVYTEITVKLTAWSRMFSIYKVTVFVWWLKLCFLNIKLFAYIKRWEFFTQIKSRFLETCNSGNTPQFSTQPPHLQSCVVPVDICVVWCLHTWVFGSLTVGAQSKLVALRTGFTKNTA